MQKNLADLITHLTEHAVRTDGPFTLRSGAVSDWYLDARQTTFSGVGARFVGEVMLDFIPTDVAAVGGLTMGADPVALATAISAVSRDRSLVAFSIRKESKDHGTGGRLVGPVAPGTRVANGEDTTSTGGAMVEATRALVEQMRQDHNGGQPFTTEKPLVVKTGRRAKLPD